VPLYPSLFTLHASPSAQSFAPRCGVVVGTALGRARTPGSMPLKSDPSTWTDPRQVRGLAGEKLAQRHLQATGWPIPASPVPHGPVRRRSGGQQGPSGDLPRDEEPSKPGARQPASGADVAKRLEIVRVARERVDRHGRLDDAYRVDMIGIRLSPAGRSRLDHLDDALRVGSGGDAVRVPAFDSLRYTICPPPLSPPGAGPDGAGPCVILAWRVLPADWLRVP